MKSLACLICFFLTVCLGLVRENEERRLIEFSPGQTLWLTSEQLDEIDEMRHKVNKLGVGYFDVTDFQEPVSVPLVEQVLNFPSGPSKQQIVNPLLPMVSPTNLKNYITGLSSFRTRYYTTETSLQASQYLLDLLQGFVTQAGRKDANCSFYTHSWVQPSVICTIQGTELGDELVITGAHLDSINSRATPNGVAPGADDDASGVASFVETFRILMQSNYKPKRTLQFMAYAAEEVGLRGSQEISRAYRAQRKNVYAVYQNEMSGYTEGTPSVVILQDFVNANLTKFVESLVGEYLDISFTRAVCGYGCSDHASWNRDGYATTCTAEAGPFGNVNPNMHTDKDVVGALDMTFTAEFAKLCLAFLIELS